MTEPHEDPGPMENPPPAPSTRDLAMKILSPLALASAGVAFGVYLTHRLNVVVNTTAPEISIARGPMLLFIWGFSAVLILTALKEILGIIAPILGELRAPKQVD